MTEEGADGLAQGHSEMRDSQGSDPDGPRQSSHFNWHSVPLPQARYRRQETTSWDGPGDSSGACDKETEEQGLFPCPRPLLGGPSDRQRHRYAAVSHPLSSQKPGSKFKVHIPSTLVQPVLTPPQALLQLRGPFLHRRGWHEAGCVVGMGHGWSSGVQAH